MSRPAPLPTDLVVGLGAAVVLAAGLTATRGMLAGGLVGGLAVSGLLARWAAVPPLMLFVTAYLSLYPDGLPDGGPGGRGATGPQLLDLLTAGAMVVYAAGHYRYLTQIAEAGDDPTADDLARLFAGAAAAVMVGTVVFYVTTRLKPDYDRGPFGLILSTPTTESQDAGGRLGVVFARFLMLAGLLGGGALLAGLGLWLTRLSRLTPVEARQLLLDTRWREARRELARLETWRAAVLRPPVRRLRRRFGRALAVGAAVFGATFLGFLWVLSRLN